MRLSICIPTHQGRCASLKEALESIAAQVRSGLDAEVEVVVSDNASDDGTEAMVTALRERHPSLMLVYARNERDMGLENIMLAVERASGEWCWLFGSDDVMAADGLAAVVATIRAHPEATGIAVARTNFDHTMQRRIQADPPETAPGRRETTVIHGFAEIMSELAFQFGFLSVNVVRRKAWLEAAADAASMALRRYPDWPHLSIFAALARRRPTWVWLPTVLVLVRAGRSYLVDGDGEQPNLARLHVRLVDGLRRSWRQIAAGDAALRHALMQRTLRVAASHNVVKNIKLSPGHGLAWDLRLAWSFVRSFGSLKSFWREVAPLLAMPAPAYRAFHRARLRKLRPMPVLTAAECSVDLSAELPTRWWAREMPLIRCRVRNTGTVVLRTAGDCPIHVGGRWFSLDGELLLETVRDPLPASVPPGGEVELLVRTHTPWDTGRYRLELGCVQENVRWLSEADPSNALVAEVEVEVAGTGIGTQ